jgi:hypothetical protein
VQWLLLSTLFPEQLLQFKLHLKHILFFS